MFRRHADTIHESINCSLRLLDAAINQSASSERTKNFCGYFRVVFSATRARIRPSGWTINLKLLRTTRSEWCHWTYSILREKWPTDWPARFINHSKASNFIIYALFVLWTLIASGKLLFIHAFKCHGLLRCWRKSDTKAANRVDFFTSKTMTNLIAVEHEPITTEISLSPLHIRLRLMLSKQ